MLRAGSERAGQCRSRQHGTPRTSISRSPPVRTRTKQGRETRHPVNTRKRRGVAYCFRDARKAACPFASMLALDIAPDGQSTGSSAVRGMTATRVQTRLHTDGVATGQDLG